MNNVASLAHYSLFIVHYSLYFTQTFFPATTYNPGRNNLSSG